MGRTPSALSINRHTRPERSALGALLTPRGHAIRSTDPAEMTEGYDMGSAKIPDPVAFGWNVADFDIGDPGTATLAT